MSPWTINSWKSAGQFFEYRRQKIFCIEEGSGPPLVLIHGFPTSSYDWSYVWDTLKTNYRLLACDLIGFGFSDKPLDYAYGIADQADIVEAMLVAKGIHSCHILAHDYGDTVAQEMLARQRERMHGSLQPARESASGSEKGGAHKSRDALRYESVCFLNGGLFPEVHRPRFLQKLLISPLGSVVTRLINEKTFRKSFSEVFGKDTRPSDGELRAFWDLVQYNRGTRIYHKLIRYMKERRIHRQRWITPLLEPDQPIRIINGSVDPVSGHHMVERYVALVPQPDVVSLSTIGHYPQTEAPKEVVSAYMEFRHSMDR
ncbi:MAG: alpha/beta fold hydrolase [Leptospiraceae bacterium]|nr:alpha/beta fold hydrolase [Leptospiraceae bacterium]